MTPISKRDVKECLNNHKPEIVARLHINNKLVTALIAVGERKAYEPLCTVKFRMLVDYYEALGFINPTALRLARYGCGKNSANPDNLYYVVDGKLVGITDIQPTR